MVRGEGSMIRRKNETARGGDSKEERKKERKMR